MSHISNNTRLVEFKAIDSYASTNNTLHQLRLNKTPEWRALKQYLDDYRIPKGVDSNVNITNPNLGRFNIDNTGNLSVFFEKLLSCHNKKLVLNFCEPQISDEENGTGSGIMIDFDILTPNPKSCTETLSLSTVLKRAMTVLNDMIDFDKKDVIYSCIIAKPSPILKEESNMYKDGFHILIPSVKLTRRQKKLYIRELIKDQRLNTLLIDALGVGSEQVIDKNCVHVPVFFLFNAKSGATEAYKWIGAYKADYYNDMSPDVCSNKFIHRDEETGVYIADSNLIMEFSLNVDGIIVKKRNYKFNDKYQSMLKSISTHDNRIEKIREDSVNTFNTLNTYYDENMEYYLNLALNVLDKSRAENYYDWRNVVFALSNINRSRNPAFKEIARQFSLRCENKFDEDAFNKLWDEATSKCEGKRLGVGSLIRWCKEDNEELYNSILIRDIKQIIEYDVFGASNKLLDGTLYQYHFAAYVYHLFRQKFVYDIDEKGKIEQWYEFVLDNDDYRQGEVFKWRQEFRPDSIMLYLSNQFIHIANSVLEKINTYIKTLDDEDEIENMKKRRDLYKRSARNLYRNDFKIGVIKEAQALFRRRGFMDIIDTAPNVMGVGNGVLELDNDNVRLLTGYHSYPVSMYTDVCYRPYNPNDPDTKYLLKVLLDLYPEDERDAFHKHMYIFATSLDGRPKDSSFWQFVGGGCNGKSSLVQLVNTVLGKYGGKINMSVLTEGRNKSAGANEQMMVYKTARLAFYSETEKAEVLNCATAKELTSQESITNRGIFEKQTTFRPNTNHIITTNHPITIKSTDYGIWRRMNLYEFKIKFTVNPDPANKRERKIDETVAKYLAEKRGVKEAMLSILVEYYKDLYKNHGGSLNDIYSPTIEAETLEYRNKQDTLNRFICSSLVFSPNSEIQLNAMVDQYETWLNQNVGRSAVPDRIEMQTQMYNSVLIKFAKKTNTMLLFKDIRFIAMESKEDTLRDDECMLSTKIGCVSVAERRPYDESKYNPLGI